MTNLVREGRELLWKARMAKTAEAIRGFQAEMEGLIERASGKSKEELMELMESFVMLAEARELES